MVQISDYLEKKKKGFKKNFSNQPRDIKENLCLLLLL